MNALLLQICTITGLYVLTYKATEFILCFVILSKYIKFLVPHAKEKHGEEWKQFEKIASREMTHELRKDYGGVLAFVATIVSTITVLVYVFSA